MATMAEIKARVQKARARAQALQKKSNAKAAQQTTTTKVNAPTSGTAATGQKLHASGMTQAQWDARNKPRAMVSTPGVTNQNYTVSASGVFDESGNKLSKVDAERLGRTLGYKSYDKIVNGRKVGSYMAPNVGSAQVSYDPNQQIGSKLLPTGQDRLAALTGQQAPTYNTPTQQSNYDQTYQSPTGQVAMTSNGQVNAGYKAVGTGNQSWRSGNTPNIYSDLGFSDSQAAYDQQRIKALADTYDPLMAQIDEYSKLSNETFENVRNASMGLYDSEIASLEAETKNQLSALDSQVNQAVEQTASRFAFSGFGRSSEHLGAQAQIQAEGVRAKEALNQEMMAKIAYLKAEKAGADSDVLSSLQQNIMNAQQQKAEIQQGINDLVAQERLSMLQANEENKAMAEVEAQQMAHEQQGKQNEYLKMQGLMINPFTNEIEEIPMGANAVNVELSKATGYMVDDYGNPITDSWGNLRDLESEQSKYQLQSDQMGGMYVFDPSTGQVVNKYDMFGNMSGGVPSMNDFSNLFGGGSVNTAQVGQGLQSAVEATGPSKYRKNGYECAEAVNRITDGYHLGSNYTDKMKQVTKQNNPQVGNALVIPYGSKQYGHAEMVISAPDINGNFQTVSWNKKNDGQQTFESHNIYDLQNQYGQNWGFTNSQLKQDVAPIVQPSMGSMPSYGGISEQQAYQEAVNRGLTGQDAIMAAKTWSQAGFIPEDLEAAEAARLAQSQQAGDVYKAAKQGQVMNTLDDVISGLDWSNTGAIGAMSANIPGTSAYNLSKQLETLKANIGFGELQAMREASKTGGALGQVSERELSFLNSVLGSMDIGQSKEQLQKNLEDIRNSLQVFYNAGGGQYMQGETPSMSMTTSGGSASDMLAEYGIF